MEYVDDDTENANTVTARSLHFQCVGPIIKIKK